MRKLWPETCCHCGGVLHCKKLLVGDLGSCFPHLSLWNWDLTEVTGTSKAHKYTEVLDLILGEGSLYGCSWALGKGHEGKEHYEQIIPISIQLLTLPWSFLSLSMLLLSQIFPCFGVYSSNAAFPCPSDGSLHADLPGSPWELVLLGVTAVSWELFWQGFFNPVHFGKFPDCLFLSPCRLTANMHIALICSSNETQLYL